MIMRHSTNGSPQGIAYSYLRFSRPEQARGDSRPRQGEGPAEWCARNGIRLDTTTTLHDLGKSAFKKGKHRQAQAESTMARLLNPADLVNPDRRGLAAFLELIRQGKVPRGAYLIIENLDRLSRDDAIPATHLLTGILLAGVRVVQLEPELVLTDKSDTFEIMRAILELSRGNSESAMKSKRLREVWGDKKRQAREGRPMSHRLPGWLQLQGATRIPGAGGRERWSFEQARIVPIPAHAATVRRIFEMAAGGYGMKRIVDTLTREKVPTPGRSQKWNRAYVRNILNDRRALGEHQPRHPDGSTDGPVIKGFYPAIVDEDLFLQARADAAQRLPKRCPPGTQSARSRKPRKPVAQADGHADQDQPERERHINLFAGLLRHAVDGDTFTQLQRDDTRREDKDANGRPRRCNSKHWVLRNIAALEGAAKAVSFHYQAFERGILAMLAEVDPAELLPADTSGLELAHLSAELQRLDGSIAELVRELEQGGPVAALANLLRKREAEKAHVVARLDKLRQEAATPLGTAWQEAHSLLDVLDKAQDQEAARLRLRSLLRRITERIDLLIIPRGKMRFAFALVHFVGGRRPRFYLIVHRGAIVMPCYRKPAMLWAVSVVPKGANPDLSHPEEQAFCERFAAAWEEPADVLGNIHTRCFIREELPWPEQSQADDGAAAS
jgi:DNA invertase Pin-like site-specific DNA recombinase